MAPCLNGSVREEGKGGVGKGERAACGDEATAAGEDEQKAGHQSLVRGAVTMLPHDLQAHISRCLSFVSDGEPYTSFVGDSAAGGALCQGIDIRGMEFLPGKAARETFRNVAVSCGWLTSPPGCRPRSGSAL